MRRAGVGWDRDGRVNARVTSVSCIAGRVHRFPGASLRVARAAHRRIENLSFLASRPASASSARDSMRVTRGQRGVTPPRPSASRHGRSSRLQFGLCLDEYRRHACRRSRSLRGSIDRERKHQEKLTRWIGHGRSPSATHPGSAPPPPLLLLLLLLVTRGECPARDRGELPSSAPPARRARRRRRRARRSSDDEDAKTARAARERLMLLAATALTPRSPRTSTRSRSEAAHTAAGVARDGIGAPPGCAAPAMNSQKTELEHSATHFT